MLSAKSEDEDKIEGLDLGADDYVTKAIQSIRINSKSEFKYKKICKTRDITNDKSTKTYTVGELVIDDEKKKVILEGKEIKFTPTEYNILKFLCKNKGKSIFNRTNI